MRTYNVYTKQTKASWYEKQLTDLAINRARRIGKSWIVGQQESVLITIDVKHCNDLPYKFSPALAIARDNSNYGNECNRELFEIIAVEKL